MKILEEWKIELTMHLYNHEISSIVKQISLSNSKLLLIQAENAVDFIDGSPVWKVDGYRLMDEDLVLEATFRTLNIWAFVLTFALILLLLQVFAKLFSKRWQQHSKRRKSILYKRKRIINRHIQNFNRPICHKRWT